MFECLEEVSDANEEEIVAALMVADWNTETAVKLLKIDDLGKCPVDEWKFGFSNNRAVCKMILGGTGWDLDLAKSKVTKVCLLVIPFTMFNHPYRLKKTSSWKNQSWTTSQQMLCA